MEAALMAIGVNERTAPASVLERYGISEGHRSEVLTRLAGAEGIEEVIVLATCSRTEFWLWATDPTLAANSVSRLLSAEYGLKLCEWEYFYRLLDDEALLHILRVAADLDSRAAEEIAAQLNNAWGQAKKAGSTGRFLDAVMQKALVVAERVRSETATPHPVAEATAGGRRSSIAAAERILAAEAHGFRSRLLAEQMAPTIVALRHRLDQICRQELDSFREECGPFSKDQDETLLAVTSRLTQRIAGSLARELKEPPEKVGQEQMTAVVQRLFHLKTPEPALAGAKPGEERRRSWPEQRRQPPVKDSVPNPENVKV